MSRYMHWGWLKCTIGTKAEPYYTIYVFSFRAS